jgi:glycerol-3-phosphate O-acyltransferase/dihydroxyacetone phosphate acyltransferase
VKGLTQEVLKYNRMLAFYGVRDHQVKNTKIDIRIAVFRMLFRSLQIAFVILICAPVILMMAPLFYLTRRVSHEKMKEALAGSKVKISGKDVVSTWKLLTAIVVAPLLWGFYTVRVG